VGSAFGVVLVLLFEFLDLSVPVEALASVVLSRSEVALAVPVARTTFNICSLTGLILVMGIAAEDGILPLEPDQKFRSRAFAPGKDMVQGWNRKKTGASGASEGLAMVAGTLPLAFAWRGAQVVQPRASAAIAGLLMARVRRPVITPAVFFATDRNSYSNLGPSQWGFENVLHDFRRI